jgi:hypothetical protein
MKHFIAYILIRILDLHSTFLCTSKYGIDVEGNPFIREMMGRYGLFAIFNLLVSIGLYFLIVKIKYVGKLALTVFMIINLMVVTSNYLLLFFV